MSIVFQPSNLGDVGFWLWLQADVADGRLRRLNSASGVAPLNYRMGVPSIGVIIYLENIWILYGKYMED